MINTQRLLALSNTRSVQIFLPAPPLEILQIASFVQMPSSHTSQCHYSTPSYAWMGKQIKEALVHLWCTRKIRMGLVLHETCALKESINAKYNCREQSLMWIRGWKGVFYQRWPGNANVKSRPIINSNMIHLIVNNVHWKPPASQTPHAMRVVMCSCRSYDSWPVILAS